MEKKGGLFEIRKAIFEANSFCHTVQLPEKRVILDPWIYEQNLNMIFGGRGVGKTMFALSLADAVTRKQRFGPWEVKQSVPVLYLDAEMSPVDIRDRILKLNPLPERFQPLYVYCDALANHLGLPRAHLLNPRWREAIKSYLLEHEVLLFFIDNLASVSAGIDENSAKDCSPINSWLVGLRFAGITTVMLHHGGKSGDQRGTSAREDNLDVSLQLRHAPNYVPEDGCKFIVTFRKARVRTPDASQISDTMFELTENGDGLYVWHYGSVRRETKLEVLRMLSEGYTQEAIAQHLGVTRGRVSQIKTQSVNEGLLTAKGALTERGEAYLAGEVGN